jgi:diphthamide biosynthesis protein 4
MPLPDHYAVLGISASASVSELRAAYTAAALACHPDKLAAAAGSGSAKAAPTTTATTTGSGSPPLSTLSSSCASSSSPLPPGPTFLEVQAAWETLRDASSRAAYDALRRQEKEEARAMDSRTVVVSDEVHIDEMDEDENEVAGAALQNKAEAALVGVEGGGVGGGAEAAAVVSRCHPCRCGDSFRISREDQRNRINIVECNTCSLKLRVVYGESSF